MHSLWYRWKQRSRRNVWLCSKSSQHTLHLFSSSFLFFAPWNTSVGRTLICSEVNFLVGTFLSRSSNLCVKIYIIKIKEVPLKTCFIIIRTKVICSTLNIMISSPLKKLSISSYYGTEKIGDIASRIITSCRTTNCGSFYRSWYWYYPRFIIFKPCILLSSCVMVRSLMRSSFSLVFFSL